MHSVADALDEVLRRVAPCTPIELGLGPELLGRVLADSVISKADLPPFDKAMMDGVALRSEDARVGATLAVTEEITAGRVPTRSVGEGQAARIMTGAPMPAGADAVVMVEQCKFDGDRVTLADAAKPGQHIQPRGREATAGEVVLNTGTIIRPAEIGLLAMVGQTRIPVYSTPGVSIVSTGDELVDPSETPGPGQIRNSNGPMLLAQVMRTALSLPTLAVARDNRADLGNKIAAGLAGDVLILSGGVSAGKLDLVPDVLRELGVESHVHKVAMKPGKPLYFGTRAKTLVFGLPGNPVSSFVGFELFVAPALRKLMGYLQPEPRVLTLPLAESFMTAGDRPTYHPALIESAALGETVRPVKWLGSPDMRGLCRANALAIFPAGMMQLPAGSPISVLRLTA